MKAVTHLASTRCMTGAKHGAAPMVPPVTRIAILRPARCAEWWLCAQEMIAGAGARSYGHAAEVLAPAPDGLSFDADPSLEAAAGVRLAGKPVAAAWVSPNDTIARIAAVRIAAVPRARIG